MSKNNQFDTRVVALGATVGTYQGHDIPGWFESSSGYRYEYIGICPDPIDLSLIKEGQSVLAPGLLYQVITGEIKDDNDA